MPKIKMYVSLDLNGCKREDEIEYDDEEWSQLTEEQKERELDVIAEEFAWNHIEIGAYVND